MTVTWKRRCQLQAPDGYTFRTSEWAVLWMACVLRCCWGRIVAATTSRSCDKHRRPVTPVSNICAPVCLPLYTTPCAHMSCHSCWCPEHCGGWPQARQVCSRGVCGYAGGTRADGCLPLLPQRACGVLVCTCVNFSVTFLLHFCTWISQLAAIEPPDTSLLVLSCWWWWCRLKRQARVPTALLRSMCTTMPSATTAQVRLQRGGQSQKLCVPHIHLVSVSECVCLCAHNSACQLCNHSPLSRSLNSLTNTLFSLSHSHSHSITQVLR